MDSIVALFVCPLCGLRLYTWWAAAKAERDGCPECRCRTGCVNMKPQRLYEEIASDPTQLD